MNWEQLLSLKRFGDTNKRLRNEQDDTRLGFEVDYDRIIFSSGFRSLQDKTQVIPLSKTDFVHTRLTHSLEVSVVGRSLGRIVGKKLLEKHPHLKETLGHQFNDFGAIVAAAALSHDIGNPPFGHSGEKAIGEYFSRGNGKRFKDSLTRKEFQDLTHFEGNANGFKLLTQDKKGISGGLRLSYATLGAFMKYPKPSLPHQPTKHIAHKKFGYFSSDEKHFHEVARELGLLEQNLADETLYSRHPLTYLVEAADDICYTIIDFEDGINLGLIEEDFALEYLIKLVKDHLNVIKYHQLSSTADRVSYLRALAIGVLINEAAANFIKHEDEILSGEFSKSLMDVSAYCAQINDILKISVEKIYQSKEVVEKEIAGYKILSTLLDHFCNSIERIRKNEASNLDILIKKGILPDFEVTDDLYTNLINLCSKVASFSDGNALRLFKKIQGQELNL